MLAKINEIMTYLRDFGKELEAMLEELKPEKKRKVMNFVKTKVLESYRNGQGGKGGKKKYPSTETHINKTNQHMNIETLLTGIASSNMPTIGEKGRTGDVIAYLKWHFPERGITYYPLEFDGKDTFWGIISDRHGQYFDTFTRGELYETNQECVLEQDTYFEPVPILDLLDRPRRVTAASSVTTDQE